MGCETPYFSGLGDCHALLSKVMGSGITNKGTTFTDATFIADATWKTNIASSTPASRNTIVLQHLDYERTSEAAVVETSNLGRKTQGVSAPPSMSASLDMGAYDYQTLFSLMGSKFDIVLFLADGKRMGTRKADGTIKGFRAEIAVRGDLPPADSSQKSFPVNIFFSDLKEFENGNMVIISATSSFEEIKDYVPVGLTLVADSTLAAATGVVTLHAYKRGTTEPKTGLVLADITVLESNATAPTATTIVTEVGQGVYTVTINESIGATPSALESGEWAKVQVALIATTYITYQSNVLKLVAV